MADPNQEKIEAIIIALLQTQAPFTNSSTAPVVAWDADASTIGKKDRVIVQCEEPVPEVPARNPSVAAPVNRATVNIYTRFTTNSADTLNTWVAAVDAALATAPAGVVTLATASYPNGFTIDTVTEGNRQQDGVEQRERIKTFSVVYRN